MFQNRNAKNLEFWGKNTRFELKILWNMSDTIEFMFFKGCTQMYLNLATPASVVDSLSMFFALAPALRVHTTTSRLLKVEVRILFCFH